MPHTQPSTGQSQWVSPSADFMLASIIAQRLVKYTEQQQLRSTTQTGYRPELGTLHPAFALQHVMDKHRHAGQPLYLCFESAYDNVQWQLLWSLLHHLGVYGHMQSAFQSLYNGSLLSMRVNGQCRQSRSPSTGLRQSCPLSATLFGIFIHGLHHHLLCLPGCHSGAQSAQTWSMLMTSAPWPAAPQTCKLTFA